MRVMGKLGLARMSVTCLGIVPVNQKMRNLPV